MPKPERYSYIIKNDLPKKIIEKIDGSINTPSSCPVNSFLDTVNISPNPYEKPCHCIGTKKWIPNNGTC